MSLTYEDIDQLPAGEQTDRLIAEYVFGWRYAGFCRRGPVYYVSADDDLSKTAEVNSEANNFSSSIAAAWTVVEKMVERHTQDFHFSYLMCEGCNWNFGFMDKVNGFFGRCASSAPSAPLAICRAALKTAEQFQ